MFLSKFGKLLSTSFAHGYPLAQVAHGGVLEERGEDHDETGAQEHVD